MPKKQQNIIEDITLIKKNIKIIDKIKTKIYKYINITRYQFSLIQDKRIWNQICSSLYVIDDTLLSMEDYVNNKFPDSDGLKYIFTYGILQSLFIQQDAIRNLAEAFKISFTYSELLIKIRDLRNSSIGHPTKQDTKKKRFYNYISRISLQKQGFTLQKADIEHGKDIFLEIDIINTIKTQLEEIIPLLRKISNTLIKNDQNHKRKYKGELMTSIFSNSINYYFEKVDETINSPKYGKKEYGLSMLELVEKDYNNFESELIKRNELPGNEILKYDITQYKHATNRLRDYLKGNSNQMVENDARIYLFYLREKHEEFLDIAKGYDIEYNK